ncbi:MAG TPA: protease inhibitor I42 family protein [Spirochaetota bacterium]|nr:protease inhibitor I42 family protein [Spirochaetota bacterium]
MIVTIKKSGLLYVLVLMIMVAGCTKDMKEPCTTINTAHYKGEAIVINNDGCVTFEMESQLSTGYHWSFKIEQNPVVLVNSDYKVETMQQQVVGGVDREIFTFKAVKPGTAIIVFEYTRAFDKNQKPVKSKEYTVTIVE